MCVLCVTLINKCYHKCYFSIQFSNLLGAVYRRGNLSFTQDGDNIVSPVGNRITKFDLKK